MHHSLFLTKSNRFSCTEQELSRTKDMTASDSGPKQTYNRFASTTRTSVTLVLSVENVIVEQWTARSNVFVLTPYMPRYFVNTKGLPVLANGGLLKKQQGEILNHPFFE